MSPIMSSLAVDASKMHIQCAVDEVIVVSPLHQLKPQVLMEGVNQAGA